MTPTLLAGTTGPAVSNTYQLRTYQGKTTLIDATYGGYYSVILSYSPLGPAEHSTLVRTLTDAEGYTREHGWPVPGDELVTA